MKPLPLYQRRETMSDRPILSPSDKELFGGKDVFERYAPKGADDISLDYLHSEVIEDIEAGIRETVKGVEVAIITAGLALAKIAKTGLYIDAGFRSLSDYLEHSDSRLRMPKQTASDYIKIAETWVRYYDLLKKHRFQLEGNITKLRILPMVIDRYGEDALAEINDLSYREFRQRYSVSDAETTDPVDVSDFRVAGGRIQVNGVQVAELSPELDSGTRKELSGIFRKVFDIKSRGNMPLVVDVYDEKEARAIDRMIKRYRQTK
jgi:hypothetical protein